MEVKRQQYKYDAFISYRHSNYRDRFFATQLERFLESYRPEWSADKYTSKIEVFRDVSDLSGNNLTNELMLRLDQSRFLIVVCSKSSKSSEYIGKEIRYFLSKRKTSHLILVVLDGDPSVSANLKDSPFRAEIRDNITEPFGFDFRRNRYKILEFSNRKLEHKYAILSEITGVEKNLLIDRARRKRDLKRIVISGALFFFIFGFIFYSKKIRDEIIESAAPRFRDEIIESATPVPSEVLSSYITANDLLLDTINLGVVELSPLSDAILKHNAAYEFFANNSHKISKELKNTQAEKFKEIVDHVIEMNNYLRENMNAIIGKFNIRENKSPDDRIEGAELEALVESYRDMQLILIDLYRQYKSIE